MRGCTGNLLKLWLNAKLVVSYLSANIKALAHYKDFHNDFSKKIVVKIVANI